MVSAIPRDEVAPGDGALRTWMAPSDSAMTKSSTSFPLADTAWARTPAPLYTRSSDWIAGMRR